MRLTGEAARRWLAQNPGASYVDNRTGQQASVQPQGPQPGFLQSLFTGITKPFRMGAGIAGEFGRTATDLGRAAQGDWSASQMPEYSWLSEEERRELEDPLRAGGKAGAALLAYGVPAGAAAGTVGTGARIGQAAGRGAIAGGMGGFGYSKEGEELKGLGTGAALGGVLGGALQGGREVASKIRAADKSGLTKVGESIETPSSRPSASKGGVNTPLKAQEISKNMEKTIKENLELVKDTRPDLVSRYKGGFISQTEKTELLEEIAREANNRASVMRGAFPDKVDVAKLQEKIVKSEFLQKNPTAHSALRKSGFFEDFSRLGEQGTTIDGKMAQYATKDELYRFLKDNVDSQLNYAKIAAKTGGTTPQLQRAYQNVQRTLRNEIEKGLGSQYQHYNQVSSNFFRAAETGHLARISNDELARGIVGQGGGIPLVSDVVESTPVRTALGRTRNLLGRGLQSVGQAPAAAAPAISGLMGAGQRAIPAMPAIQDSFSARQPTQPAQPTQLGEMGLGTPQPEMGGGLNKMALAQAVLGGEISATEANFLLKMFESEDKALDPKAKDALRIVDEIEGLVDRVGLQESAFLGKVTGPARTLGGAVGLDPELEMYNDTIKGFSAKLSRAMGESGMLTDRDIVRALNLFPKITDSQAIAKEKLNRLRDFLSQAMTTPAQTVEPTVGADSESALYKMLGL